MKMLKKCIELAENVSLLGFIRNLNNFRQVDDSEWEGIDFREQRVNFLQRLNKLHRNKAVNDPLDAYFESITEEREIADYQGKY